jgi:hypothetical protein
MFLLTDFSANNNTGIMALTKDALAAPLLFDYGLSMFTKSFADTNLPALTTLTSRAGTYTPTRNLLSLAALDQFRANDSETTGLGRQINTGTAAADASGGYTFGLGLSSFSGGITPDGCFSFGMPGPSNDSPTSMSLAIKINF